MIINKKVLILLVFLMGTSWFYAQSPIKDRIKTLKIAFITERLSLSSKEAQSFWPVYNEHHKKIEGFRQRERKRLTERMDNIIGLSNTEADMLLEELIGLESEKQEAKFRYLKKVRTVLSAKKVLLLIKAEEDFKKRLLQQYRKRQHNRKS